MFALQGWFRSGFFVWPLPLCHLSGSTFTPRWCPADTPCPLRCILGPRRQGHIEIGLFLSCLPFVLLHLSLFYVSAAVIFLLRKKGKWPEHTGHLVLVATELMLRFR